jgi:hypothetical protein
MRWGVSKIFCFALVLILVSGAFSGCISGKQIEKKISADDGAKEQSNESFAGKPHVVVALLDSGINPYHEVFRRPNNTQPPWTYIPGFPKDAIALNLTFNGTYQENVEADKDTWTKVEKGKVYWIPHTCIAGAVSFSVPDSSIPLPIYPALSSLILDEISHGTITSSCVVKANPNATIFMIQCGYKHCEEALCWAINQSWIDIISFEFGNNNGLGLPVNPEFYGIPKVSEQGWKAGKILISATGNRPVASIGQPESAPPAFISIGGGNEDAHGEIAMSSKLPDYITKWIHNHTAIYTVDGYETSGACSWAMAYASGVFSSIILKAREELNYNDGIKDGTFIKIQEKNISITNQDIRDAVNKTAIYWSMTDYDATKNQLLPNVSDPNGIVTSLEAGPLSISIPVAPLSFLQMGWGYIGPEIVNETVDILLGRKEWTPTQEKQLAEPYMNAIYELRKQFWDNWPLGAQ